MNEQEPIQQSQDNGEDVKNQVFNINNTKLLAGIAVVLGALVAIGAGAYFYAYKSEPQQTACTLEAKICPDGSAVGRTGPNCEFAQCPGGKGDEVSVDEELLELNKRYSAWEVPLYLDFEQNAEHLGNGFYLLDKRILYKGGSGLITVLNADPATFEVLGGGHARDVDTIFYTSEIINAADYSTFTVLGEGHARDKDNTYYRSYAIGNDDLTNLLHASIDELGIAFNYPESWGELIYRPFKDGAAFSIAPTISFQNYDRQRIALVSMYFPRGLAHAAPYPPLVTYKGADHPLNDICENNAYLDDFYDFTISECSLETNSSGVDIAVFKVRYAIQYPPWDVDPPSYDYDKSRTIPKEEREYQNQKLAYIHTKSERWSGLVTSVYFDAENIEINTLREKVFDAIIGTLSYLE